RPRTARHLQRLLSLHPRPGRPPHRAVHLGLPHRRSGSRADPMVARRPAAPDVVGPSGAEVVVRGGLRIRRGAAASACAGGAADGGAMTEHATRLDDGGPMKFLNKVVYAKVWELLVLLAIIVVAATVCRIYFSRAVALTQVCERLQD